MDDHLRVGLGFENVPFVQEKVSQFPEVVDFSVKGDPDGAVLIRERLMPAAEIDNRETSVAKRHLGGYVDSLIIRASMGYGTEHCPDEGRINAGAPLKIQFSANSAHGQSVKLLVSSPS